MRSEEEDRFDAGTVAMEEREVYQLLGGTRREAADKRRVLDDMRQSAAQTADSLDDFGVPAGRSAERAEWRELGREK